MSLSSSLVFFPVYSVLVVGLLGFVIFIRQRRRTGRLPFQDDARVMRRAGEQLNRELGDLRESLEIQGLILLALPLIGLLLPLWIVRSCAPEVHWSALTACVALALAALVFMMRKMLKTLDEIKNKRLGLFGERLTADHLETLRAEGFAVFHDVPCTGAGGQFNLDHVVVGRGAVGVVETKTYSKRAGVNGPDHKLSYDGRQLIWPNKTSTSELEQVKQGAQWLQDEIKKRLNITVPVRAALTVPGWYVTGGPPQAEVLVENTKRLPRFICERFQGGLTRQQEDLVCRHLRAVCETVSFDAIVA